MYIYIYIYMKYLSFIQVNARTELALRYNDISPLENHHCSVAFEILGKEECNIFRNVSAADFKIIRDGMIKYVLTYIHSYTIMQLSLYLCIQVCGYVCLCMHVFWSLCVCVCVHGCMCMYRYICVCMYVVVCVCCIYACVCTANIIVMLVKWLYFVFCNDMRKNTGITFFCIDFT